MQWHEISLVCEFLPETLNVLKPKAQKINIRDEQVLRTKKEDLERLTKDLRNVNIQTIRLLFVTGISHIKNEQACQKAQCETGCCFKIFDCTLGLHKLVPVQY